MQLTAHAEWDTVLGRMTSISDSNGRITRASYDSFGRATGLVKPCVTTPCDSDALPTVKISYFDTARPVMYVTEQREVEGSAERVRPTLEFYDGRGQLIEIVSLAQTRSDR